jgi:hypothetical protein
MKKKSTLYFLGYCMMFFLLFSCGDQKKLSKDDLLLAHIPIPPKLDSAMRHSFDTVTYKILKKLNPKNVKSFKVSKENYLKMIDQIPVNAERVAFSFVQFNKVKFPNKYQELTKFDGSLYLLYYYMDKSGNNVGNKAYAMLDVNNIVEVSEADYQIMENDYIQNIKPQIDAVVQGAQGNTLRVIIPKDELLAYKNRVNAKSNVKNFKITLAQWVNYEALLTSNETHALRNKLKMFNDESAGQMTFITDCQNAQGSDIESLSGFDLNQFCPDDCQ